MRKIKMFIVGIILFFTMLSIAYLAYIAQQLDKYAVSRNDGRKCIVLYSSSGGRLKNSQAIDGVLEGLNEKLILEGTDSINLGIKNNIDSNELTKQLLKQMGGNKKYILVDINTTDLLYNKRTALVKLNSNSLKYKENLSYANVIKNEAEPKGIKLNIIGDSKSNLDQDMGYRAIRIEISTQNTIEDAKKLMDDLLYGLGK